jgi:hypothetical protein
MIDDTFAADVLAVALEQSLPYLDFGRRFMRPTLAPSKGRLIRCTVPGSTPNRAAILRTPSVRPGSSRAARMRFSSSGAIGAACRALAFALGPRQPRADSFLNSSALFLDYSALSGWPFSVRKRDGAHGLLVWALAPLLSVCSFGLPLPQSVAIWRRPSLTCPGIPLRANN